MFFLPLSFYTTKLHFFRIQNMATDFILIANEDNEVVFQQELNTDDILPTAMFVAHASIDISEEVFEDLKVYKIMSANEAQIIFVTNRKINNKTIQRFLEQIENALCTTLLHINIGKSTWIESDYFDSELKMHYVNFLCQ